MTTIEISQSEAFLLGLVSGEFQEEHCDPFDVRICERLRPFVPNLAKKNVVQIDFLPADAQPHDLGDPFKKSAEFELLFPHEGRWIASWTDNSRKSLADLAVMFLAERCTARGPDSQTKEVAAEISRLLKALAVEHACEDPFNTGQLFGELLGLYTYARGEMQTEDFIHGVAETDSLWVPTSLQFEEQRGRVLSRLQDNALLKDCWIAYDVIQDAFSRWSTLEYFVKNGMSLCVDVDDPKIVTELDGGVQTLWLSVGMLFSHLRAIDRAPTSKQLPRSFLEKGAKSLPLLAGALETVQACLYRGVPELSPDTIVFMLVPGVEPLVKDLWDTSGKSVSQTLSDQLSSTTPEVNKFASIGRSLFLTYRHTAIHEGHVLNRKVASWGEALFVYTAMRFLVELHDVIKSRQPKN